MKTALFLILLFTVATAQATSYYPEQELEVSDKPKPATEGPGYHPFMVQEIAPAIPRAWKLVSVSAGDKPGGFAIWFQADDGAVYVMRGDFMQDRLTLHEPVLKIPVK